MNKKCPGMDPAYYTFKDIQLQPCIKCGTEIEFWKRDVFLTCPSCKTRNVNPRVGSTCLSWCKEAEQCIGNSDIKEWLEKNGGECEADKK